MCTYKNNTNDTYDAMNFKHFFWIISFDKPFWFWTF
ncbi:hypothetical protein Q604_UNBC02097G0001, partial [human gut metagenome]